MSTPTPRYLAPFEPKRVPHYFTDVLVIGSGLAGMAAGLFAATRGLSVVQAGHTGEIIFASGLLDLLGVHPVGAGRVREDPWEALGELAVDRAFDP